jgi:hypothetical protein
VCDSSLLYTLVLAFSIGFVCRDCRRSCGATKACTTHSDCKPSDTIVGGPIAGRGKRDLVCLAGKCTADQQYTDNFEAAVVVAGAPIAPNSVSARVIGDGVQPEKGECPRVHRY